MRNRDVITLGAVVVVGSVFGALLGQGWMSLI